jgi:hypothetical protein
MHRPYTHKIAQNQEEKYLEIRINTSHLLIIPRYDCDSYFTQDIETIRKELPYLFNPKLCEFHISCAVS